jgi:hypothetical protein
MDLFESCIKPDVIVHFETLLHRDQGFSSSQAPGSKAVSKHAISTLGDTVFFPLRYKYAMSVSNATPHEFGASKMCNCVLR